jgi:hypothetical protein
LIDVNGGGLIVVNGGGEVDALLLLEDKSCTG